MIADGQICWRSSADGCVAGSSEEHAVVRLTFGLHRQIEKSAVLDGALQKVEPVWFAVFSYHARGLCHLTPAHLAAAMYPRMPALVALQASV